MIYPLKVKKKGMNFLMIDGMKYWTSVSKKIIGAIFAIFAIWASFKLAIFYMPFLIAFIISIIMEPWIRWIMKNLKLTRKWSSIIVFIITFGLIIAFLSFGIGTLISESTNLLEKFNDYYIIISDNLAIIKFIEIKSYCIFI